MGLYRDFKLSLFLNPFVIRLIISNLLQLNRLNVNYCKTGSYISSNTCKE